MPDVSLSRLVNQCLIPGFNGTSVPPWLARAIDDDLGGVLYFSHNIPVPAQTRELSDEVRGLRANTIIAVDEEGGDVTRLETVAGSSVPGNAALGAVDDTYLTRSVGHAMAGMIRAAGIDVDFAPSLDVNSNPNNPVIGVRSYSASAEVAARNGAAFITGLQEGGVAASAKHFPGHGDTDVDSHLALPVLDINGRQLRERDLVPFAAAVKADVKTIMVGHIRIPEFGDLPATFNPDILALGRNELGFAGVYVTDALDMAGASRGIGIGGAAVRAMNAGNDLLCLGNPVGRDDEAEYQAAHDALVDAARSGEIASVRLEEAAERIRDLVTWLERAQAAADGDAESLVEVGTAAADRAVRVIGDVTLSGPPAVVDLRKGANIAVGSVPRHVQREIVNAIPGAQPVAAGNADAVLAAATDRPLIVIVRAPHRDAEEARQLDALRTDRRDLIVVVTGWPHEPESLADRVIVAYGASTALAKAVTARLV